jgi:hypothetical protein
VAEDFVKKDEYKKQSFSRKEKTPLNNRFSHKTMSSSSSYSSPPPSSNPFTGRKEKKEGRKKENFFLLVLLRTDHHSAGGRHFLPEAQQGLLLEEGDEREPQEQRGEHVFRCRCRQNDRQSPPGDQSKEHKTKWQSSRLHLSFRFRFKFLDVFLTFFEFRPRLETQKNRAFEGPAGFTCLTVIRGTKKRLPRQKIAKLFFFFAFFCFSRPGRAFYETKLGPSGCLERAGILCRDQETLASR